MLIGEELVVITAASCLSTGVAGIAGSSCRAATPWRATTSGWCCPCAPTPSGPLRALRLLAGPKACRWPSAFEQHDHIDAQLADWLAEQDPQTAMSTLQASGIPCVVLHTQSVLDDPNLVARFWVEVPHPKMHPYRQQNVVRHLADAQPAPAGPLTAVRRAQRRNPPASSDSATSSSAFKYAAVIADAPINPGVG